MLKIKEFICNIKFYLKILLDFKDLNRYIYLSSIFINRLETILNSDLSDNIKLNNIEISYGDFKVNYEINDINAGVEVKNDFK